jgi:hypothetical protein
MTRRFAVAVLLLGLSTRPTFAQTPDPALQREAECAPRAGIASGPGSAPKILGAQDTVPRRLFGTNDLLIIGAGTSGGMQLGQEFFIRRSGVLLAHDDRAGLHAVNTLGWVSIVAANESTSIGLLNFACAAIELGDYLEPYVEPVIPAAATRADTSGDLDFSSPRHLLFGEDDHEIVGKGKFMLADVTEDVVAPGARYAIYRDVHQTGVPLAYVGEAVVVFPGPQASVVRLTLARDAVYNGDLLIPRKP